METPASISAKKNRVQTINSFKALTRHRHPSNQKYSIYAYFLVDRPKDPKEEFDPVGMYIPLGSYGTPEEAEKVAQHLIKTTGHPMICVRQTCTWGELTSKIGKNSKFIGGEEHESTKSDHARQVEKTLNEMHQAMQEREREQFERRKQIEQEIIDEKDHQTDPETIDYYIHNWVMAVKNQAAYQVYLKETEKAKQAFEKRVEAIREQYHRQPQFDKIWLDELKERLTRRDELELYEAVKTAVKEIYPQIISDIEPDVEPDVEADSGSDQPDIKLDEDSSNPDLDEEDSSSNSDDIVLDEEIGQEVHEDSEDSGDSNGSDQEAPLDELMDGSNEITSPATIEDSEALEPFEPLDEELGPSGNVDCSLKVKDADRSSGIDEQCSFDDIIQEHCSSINLDDIVDNEIEEDADVILDEDQGNETPLDEFLSTANQEALLDEECNQHCSINMTDLVEQCPLRSEPIISEMIKVEPPTSTIVSENLENNQAPIAREDSPSADNEPISASRKKNQRKKAARKAKQQRQKGEQPSV
jgi:hypothetical protein